MGCGRGSVGVECGYWVWGRVCGYGFERVWVWGVGSVEEGVWVWVWGVDMKVWGRVCV